MALIVKDRVRETSTTTGTGTITLAGASTGFRSFADIGNANTTYYCISNNNQFEVGVGTYTASGTTLSRDTVLSNSLGTTALINFSAGTKDVFVTYPSDKAILGTTSAVSSTGTGSVVLSTNPTLSYATFTNGAGFNANIVVSNTEIGKGDGDSSILIGQDAKANAIYDIAIGRDASKFNNGGIDGEGSNTVVGTFAMSNTSGFYETVAIGSNINNSSGSGGNENVYIGNNIFGSTQPTNEIAIGHGSSGGGSNTTVIGKSATLNSYIYGSLSLNNGFASAQNYSTNQTTGAVTIGGTGATGAITIGRSTGAQTVNIATGVTAASTTKAVNIGTAGNATSTTNIAIGSTTGTSTTTVNGYFKPPALASAPTYVKGAVYFDTTLNKLRVGGATTWETITSA